jgi:predicted ArsR family transcriptional regulator
MPHDPVEAVSLLGEPVRRRLYDYVAASGDAVGRDEAANAAGITRSLAAFHLDKLASEGLLEVEFRRLSGRNGPGAGRPAKLYRRADRHIEVSLPPRDFELAARLFAQALEAGGPDGLRETARSFGRELATTVRERAGRRGGAKHLLRVAEEVLGEHGFEPFHSADGAVRLRNCPFHPLSREHTALVCGMNRDVIESLLEALELARIEARLEPQPGACCVALHKQ